jgi:hypothetical protein
MPHPRILMASNSIRMIEKNETFENGHIQLVGRLELGF